MQTTSHARCMARCAFGAIGLSRFNAPRAGHRSRRDGRLIVYARRLRGRGRVLPKGRRVPGRAPACRSVELTDYHPSPRQSYQRADEYLKGSVPTLSAITRPLHFPAVMGRSARVCVNMRTGPCRTVCACCMYACILCMGTV